jgi:hypothetical protein
MPHNQPEGRRSNNYNQPPLPAPAAPVPPPLSGVERLERMDKGYRPAENYWEEERPPLKWPFEGREIPGLPEGMTIPPRQPLPIQGPAPVRFPFEPTPRGQNPFNPFGPIQ